MAENKTEFEKLMQRAAELRGHLCLGLPLGIKMAQIGLKLLNLTEEEKHRDLVVFVENDKCPADAIQIATGCSAGSRKFKMMNYGKSAATFVNGKTGSGYRVFSKKDYMKNVLKLGVQDNLIKEGQQLEENSKLERQVLMNAFMKLPAEELLDFQVVKIILTEPLLPSRTEFKKVCTECGEEIMGGKGIVIGDKIMCKACLDGSYYVPT